jgi:hypothetical protein
MFYDSGYGKEYNYSERNFNIKFHNKPLEILSVIT